MTLQFKITRLSGQHKRNERARKFQWKILFRILLVSVPLYSSTRTLQRFMSSTDSADSAYSHLSSIEEHLKSNDPPRALIRDETVNPFTQQQAPMALLSEATRKPSSTVTRKWAYAFLLGGCNPQQPEYRGFLYNVMMACRRLRRMGSRAEFVLHIQMSVYSMERRLPASEEELLGKLNIQFKYIPGYASSTHETFYALMMEKFRILEYAGKYSRVLFLDSDQWPLCPLDYLFELSEPLPGQEARLKENVLLAWKQEPCNGGFFMFAPKPGDFDAINTIIHRREEEALQMEYPYWNYTIGWGHIFHETDKWQSPLLLVDEDARLEWGWHGSFTDQGLIYYWAKYVKKSVSIIIYDQKEDWGDCDGKACLLSKQPADLNMFDCPGYKQPGSLRVPPYSTIYHLTGKSKPWVGGEVGQYSQLGIDWLKELKQMEKDLLGNGDLSTELARLAQRKKRPPVGSFPGVQKMIEHIKEKKLRNWDPYLSEEELADLF